MFICYSPVVYSTECSCNLVTSPGITTNPNPNPKMNRANYHYWTPKLFQLVPESSENSVRTGGGTTFSRAKSRIALNEVSYESTFPKNPSFRAFRIPRDSGQLPITAESVMEKIWARFLSVKGLRTSPCFWESSVHAAWTSDRPDHSCRLNVECVVPSGPYLW